jgi:hypothetical protein
MLSHPISANRDHDPRCFYDEQQVKILTDAFTEALRLSDIIRSDLRAEAIAHRIIGQFLIGERDPMKIARVAAAN